MAEMSLYARRKADGLCGMCGKVETGGELCPNCKEKCRQRAEAKREKRRGAGGCIQCGTPIEVGTRCETCKGAQKVSRTKTVAKKKEIGQCVHCSNTAKEGCTSCQQCIDKMSAVSSAHYRRRKAAGSCRFCDCPPAKDDGSLCVYHKEKYREYRFQIKLEVMEAYGGAVCALCRSIDIDVLEIDHIEGGGTKHRQEMDLSGGYSYYLWLRRENYPPGFRVLCPTCNKKAHRERLAAQG